MNDLTKDSESKVRKEITCDECNYTWKSNYKRPNPRFITCPNCRANIELRESKLK